MSRLLKAGVSFLLLLLLVYFVDPSSVIQTLGKVPLWEFLGGAVPVQVLILILMGWTWHRLLRRCGGFSLWNAVLGNLMVLFYGTLLPGRFSALVGAPMVFSSLSEELSLEDAAGCTYLHLMGYLSVYGLGAGVGLFILFATVDKWLLFLLLPVGAYVGVGATMIGLSLFGGSVNNATWSWVPFDGAIRQSRYVSELLTTIETQRNQIRGWITEGTVLCEISVLFVLAVILLPGLRAYLLFRGMGVYIPLPYLMVVLPAVYSVTILPLSFGGMGLAEGSAIGVFVLLGYDPVTVTAVVLLDRVLAVYLPGLAGWGAFSWNHLWKREATSGGTV